MNVTHELSEDGMTLIVRRRVPGKGTLNTTYHRREGAGPFTEEDIALTLSFNFSEYMEPGQRNISRRRITRWGTLWTHVMTGPPTWWLPKVSLKGGLLVGWLRWGIEIKFERKRS